MAQKSNKVKTSAKKNFSQLDTVREKWGKIGFFILTALVFEVAICLIIGWIFGDGEFTKIQDTFVTAFMQNYNYILGAVCLLPVIAYLFNKIKKKLSEKFMTDDKLMMYGFFGVIVALAAMITVCSIVYPINTSTYYGLNSASTVSIFLCPAVVLLLEVILYGILTIPGLIKEKEFWKATRKNLPIILLVVFMIWTFISCMLAPNAADDVLGAEKAKNIGASPSEVLAKTLNGCYNLKDGYWAFMMYGSVLLVAALIGKEKIKEKKLLIKGFVVTILILSLITISLTAYGNYLTQKYEEDYKVYEATKEEQDISQELTIDHFRNYATTQSYKIYDAWYIYPQRALFRNSNHFAYVLCMAILASAILVITEKNFYEKLLYIISFAVMLYMLIINNTFGGYLGVAVALICLCIYSIVQFIMEIIDNGKNSEKNSKNSLVMFLTTILILGIFIGATYLVKDGNGKPIAIRNIETFVKDVGIFGGFMINEEKATEVDVSELDESITLAGSGRGETWLKVWELIKQRPMFGYGLECLLFQFNGQFNVNEGRTHNLLLQLLATVGIPGTLMYFTALAIVLIRLLKNFKTWDDIEKICVFVGIAYIVTALTGNSSYYTSPYFMMFLGFVLFTPWKREQIEK